MHVPEGAIDARRLVEHLHAVGRHHEAALSWLHGGIASLTKQQRQPTDFQVRARADDELRASHLRYEARARLDVVRVLRRRRSRFGADEIAAELGGESGPFRLACEYLE